MQCKTDWTPRNSGGRQGGQQEAEGGVQSGVTLENRVMQLHKYKERNRESEITPHESQ